jgi:hypothetical protein
MMQMTQMFAAWGIIISLMLFLRWHKPILAYARKTEGDGGTLLLNGWREP